MEKAGRFTGVGVGPGDPELLTLKAVRIIEECTVLAAPRTKNGEMTALGIVAGAMDLTGKNILRVDFLMQKDPVKRREMYESIVSEIRTYLDSGENVAMITIGDVAVYSTVSYVADVLRTYGYQAEMVPGIISFSAVAARLGISLTKGDEPLIVIPATAGSHEIERYLKLPGTKVLMKTGRNLDSVLEVLERLGLLHKTGMVVNCGMDDERVYPTLSGIGRIDAGYFATLIVKDDETME